jgi:choline dehydrogenase-like flavoprotein
MALFAGCCAEKVKARGERRVFRDACTVDPGESLETQIAIVGAGPAGIALGLALEKAGVSALLIESGDYRPNAAGDVLNQGTSTLEDYPFVASRARAFGGSTTRWYGACVDLDPMDFEKRDWLPFSGWPIRADDLSGYMPDARSFFGLPAASAFEPQREGAALFDHDLMAKPVFLSKPIDLGAAYRQTLQKARHVCCLMRATVTGIGQADAGHVASLEVRRPDGEVFRVRAACFVLAAGGLENPRLLLASRGRDARGIGNARDVVGRYHMEHPIRSLGILPVGGQAAAARFLGDRRRLGRSVAEVTLGLSPEARARLQVLDLHARFYRFHSLERDPAIAAAKRLLPRLRKTGGLAELRRFVGAHGPAAFVKMARYGLWHFDNKLRPGASFDHLRLWAFLEQEPDPENRVMLSSRKDRFGTPLPHLVYRETPFFQNSVRQTTEAMADGLRKSGFGALVTDEDTLEAIRHYDSYGLHPMGATRMSDTPATGVTDADLRVHGVENLFVVGSSVFPTAGAANPTLTVVLLALRLADHLARLIGKEAGQVMPRGRFERGA